MTRVYISAVMNVPLDEAWAVLRDFNGLPNYHAFFKDSFIEDGLPADRIGCVRNFKMKEGEGFVRERLLSLSDREHLCCYEIVEASLPVRGYVSEMRLRPITETTAERGATFGEWWAEFEVAPADQAAVIQQVGDTFRLAFSGTEQVALQARPR